MTLKGDVLQVNDNMATVNVHEPKKKNSTDTFIVEAENRCGAKANDRVLIDWQNKATTKVILTSFALPLVMLLLGVATGVIFAMFFGIDPIWRIAIGGFIYAICFALVCIRRVDKLSKEWQSGFGVPVVESICGMDRT